MSVALLAALLLTADAPPEQPPAAPAPSAPAQGTPNEITDHRGSLGVTAAVGGLLRSTTLREQGVRVLADVGLTAGVIGEATELVLAGRLTLGASLGGAIMAGVRPYFGSDHWKTFTDLELVVYVAPIVTVGPRAGIGVQYDFGPLVGVHAVLAGQLGFGTTLLLQGELLIGVQLRSYLFER